MTELLHMRDNYVREFDARITGRSEGVIVLDRTCFYPEGGGQVGDRGTLRDGKVTVQVADTKKVDAEVQHICTGAIPQGFGPAVHGSLRLGLAVRMHALSYCTACHFTLFALEPRARNSRQYGEAK